MKRLAMPALAILVTTCFATPILQARELTVEDRVRAQEAIERVYYSHQIGATKPFEQAVPRETLEHKVRLYLQQSAALERFWRAPVTANGLRRELERMAQGTRMPERLRELFAALDDDPVLIQECLARPTLVNRLVHSFFSRDQRVHGAARREAVRLREVLRAGQVDPHAEDPRRAVYDLVRIASQDGTQPELDEGLPRVDLGPQAWDGARARLAGVGEVSRIRDDHERFVISILLEERPHRLRVASFSVAKTRYEDWWNEVKPDLDALAVPTVASSADAQLPPVPVEGLPEQTGSVHLGSMTDAPAARREHTAVWTGSLMIVWGGHHSSFFESGGRYDPQTDTWAPTSLTEAAERRWGHTAAWTGSRMIVWGGYLENTGGRYNPATDTWLPTSTVDTASARSEHTAVWCGGLMLVWGGYTNFELDSGGRYALGNSVDDDGDGFSECDGDCNDLDAGAFALPAEASGLVFAGDKQTLVWDSAAPAAGADTVHDVVRGTLVGPAVGSGEDCLATGILEATATDPGTPTHGGGFWYLVRGRNTCGSGTYGFQSDGTERTSPVCP